MPQRSSPTPEPLPSRQYDRSGELRRTSAAVQAGEAVPIESPQAWELLQQAWDAPPDEFEYCRVRRGADEGDVYGLKPGKALEGLMFTHAGPAIYELMYEVAAAGDMTIVPPDVGPFLVREDQRRHLPPELADEAMVVGSGAELLQEIQGS